jgi:hypothetical protein
MNYMSAPEETRMEKFGENAQQLQSIALTMLFV